MLVLLVIQLTITSFIFNKTKDLSSYVKVVSLDETNPHAFSKREREREYIEKVFEKRERLKGAVRGFWRERKKESRERKNILKGSVRGFERERILKGSVRGF